MYVVSVKYIKYSLSNLNEFFESVNKCRVKAI